MFSFLMERVIYLQQSIHRDVLRFHAIHTRRGKDGGQKFGIRSQRPLQFVSIHLPQPFLIVGGRRKGLVMTETLPPLQTVDFHKN